MILLVTGGRDFCESVTSDGQPRDRDAFMPERVALGWSLDYIKPDGVIVGDATGADRWAKIWADKRGVPLSTARPDYAVVFPGGRVPNGLEFYEVNMPQPKPPVFVFGSNVAGRHGAGAALFAKQNHGAIYGVGEGRQGNAYGIPTKENDPHDPRRLITLSLDRIAVHVARFIGYARENPTTYFQLTRIGCGLAGYRWADQIGPMFADIPTNVILSKDQT